MRLVLIGMLFLFITTGQVITEDIQIKLVERIPLSQEKHYLDAYDFVVTEDGFFIIPHAKEGHLKFYEQKGELVSIFGQKGPGPHEFSLPGPCDYKDNRFIILDTGKHKIMIFERRDDFELKKLSEILCLGAPQNVKIYRSKIISPDSIRSKENKKFSLYMKDFSGKETDYLLPSYAKYGFSSEGEYERKFQEASMATSGYEFFDVYQDHVYYAWEGQAEIIKINLEDKKRVVYGKDTDNYKKPRVTPKIRKAYQTLEGEAINSERDKMSWIRGVYADDGISMLIYYNLDEETELFKPILQLYDAEGEFLKEVFLSEAATYRPNTGSFYRHEEDCLYILSARLNEEDFMDEYEILKYEIK